VGVLDRAARQIIGKPAIDAGVPLLLLPIEQHIAIEPQRRADVVFELEHAVIAAALVAIGGIAVQIGRTAVMARIIAVVAYQRIAAAEQVAGAAGRRIEKTLRTTGKRVEGTVIENARLQAGRDHAVRIGTCTGGQCALVAPDRQAVIELEHGQHVELVEIMTVAEGNALACTTASCIAASAYRYFRAVDV